MSSTSLSESFCEIPTSGQSSGISSLPQPEEHARFMQKVENDNGGILPSNARWKRPETTLRR